MTENSQLAKCIDDLASEMMAARVSRRLTKKQVASMLGMSAPTYSSCEAGNPNVTLSNFLKCIEFYGMSDSFFESLSRLSRPYE